VKIGGLVQEPKWNKYTQQLDNLIANFYSFLEKLQLFLKLDALHMGINPCFDVALDYNARVSDVTRDSNVQTCRIVLRVQKNKFNSIQLIQTTIF
jgi:hypothetical protein